MSARARIAGWSSGTLPQSATVIDASVRPLLLNQRRPRSHSKGIFGIESRINVGGSSAVLSMVGFSPYGRSADHTKRSFPILNHHSHGVCATRHDDLTPVPYSRVR